MHPGRLRPAVRNADLDEDVGRRGLRIFHKNIKIPIVVEDAGIDQLVFPIVAATLPACFYEIVVGIRILRIFIDTAVRLSSDRLPVTV